MDFSTQAQLFLLGAFVGVFGSALGLGGGIFLIPALVLYFGVPMHSALALSLVTIVATSASVAGVNARRGLANIPLGLTLEAFTVPGAVLGAWLSSRLPADLLRTVFSGMLALAALSMGRKALAPARPAAPAHEGAGALGGSYFDPAQRARVSYSVRRWPLGAFAALCAGGLSGLLGVGGGIIKVPAMSVLCGVPIKAAAATSNFMLGMTAAVSAAVFFSKGYLLPDYAAPLVLGVFAGAWGGLKLLHGLKARRLELAFAVLALAIAAKMYFAGGAR